MTEQHHEDTTTQAANFANQFLIAMPGMVEGSLAGSVIYICEHTERGALGLVINRPTDLTLGTLFERIDLELESARSGKRWSSAVRCRPTEASCCTAPAGDYSSSIKLGDMALTTSRDVLQAVADGKAGAHAGHAGLRRLGSGPA